MKEGFPHVNQKNDFSFTFVLPHRKLGLRRACVGAEHHLAVLQWKHVAQPPVLRLQKVFLLPSQAMHNLFTQGYPKAHSRAHSQTHSGAQQTPGD